MATPRFSPADLERVSEAVTKAEASTSGEIVPILLSASQDYSWFPSIMGFRVGVACFAVIELLNYFYWPLSWERTFWIVAMATVGAMAISHIPAVARGILGKKRLHQGVLDRTRSLFIREGVTETRHRTGVLVLISRFERRISILADRGIHSKLSQEFWDRLCEEFVGSVREKREVDGLCRLIERVGGELAQYFPREADDVNELPNRLRGDDA